MASRRAVEDMIRQGRVLVDGEPARLGQRVDVSGVRITVDGVPVPVAPGLVYRLLNKPTGVVTTAADPGGRPKVVDLVPTEPRVVPAGRLDMDTEGLLLLTNDGELVHRLTHPSFGVDKEYLAQVEGNPRPAALRRLRQGVELEDGMTAPARASSPGAGLVRLVIHEGRNRQVRRMCAAVGHPVVRLVRTRIGPLVDPRLAPGQWRDLSSSEVADLYAATASPSRAEAGRPGEPAAGTGPDVGYDAVP